MDFFATNASPPGGHGVPTVGASTGAGLSPTLPEHRPWCVLLVDDDPEVHDVTRLALRKFEFQQRGLELLSAYSANEAQAVFRTRKDIALALIDVVMETEHAGLELVRWVRDNDQCPLTRLVLRTGQAGLAPEEQVIRQFDIDAYREKTELTTLKLRSLLYTSLRNHRTLVKKQKDHDSLIALMQALPALRAAPSQADAEQRLRHLLQAHFELDAWPPPGWSPSPQASLPAMPTLAPNQLVRLRGFMEAACAAWPTLQAERLEDAPS